MAEPKDTRKNDVDFYIRRRLNNYVVGEQTVRKMDTMVHRVKDAYGTIIEKFAISKVKLNQKLRIKIYELIIMEFIRKLKSDSNIYPFISDPGSVGSEIVAQLEEGVDVFAKNITKIAEDANRRFQKNVKEKRKGYIESKIEFATKSGKFVVMKMGVDDLQRFGAELRLCFQLDTNIDGENWFETYKNEIQKGVVSMYLILQKRNDDYESYAVMHKETKSKRIHYPKKAGDVKFDTSDKFYDEVMECVRYCESV